MNDPDAQIVLYTSSFCGHSWAVERFLNQHGIPVQLINIDGDPEARREVMDLNHGFASVPTLVFPDGSQLTEPSFGELRAKLAIREPSIVERIRAIFGGRSE